MQKGFTLLEVIGVLIILGVLVAVAMSRVNFQPEEEITLDLIKNHIRYMQLASMNSDYICGVKFEAKKYFGFCDKNENGAISDDEKILLPGREDYDVNVDFIKSNILVVFDSYGRPFDSFVLDNEVYGELEIGVGKKIYVTKETGYIP